MAPCSIPLTRSHRVRLKLDQRGFTLIEVLVTGMILAVIVALSFFALRIYMNEWEHGRMSDTQPIEQFRRQQLVRTALESAWEYYVTDPLAERERLFYPYFKGTEQSVAFVTTSPVFEESRTAAARVRLIAATAETPAMMVYEEASFDQLYLRYYDDAIDYPRALQFPLPETPLRFRYFGLLEVRITQEGDGFEEIMGWQNSFDGLHQRVMPVRIEIVSSADDENSVMAFTVVARNRSKGPLYDTH
jgi:prepilin-type N-terminal cleavage/methylation domain-containing protein